jgi:hypothetical protein
VLFDSLGLTDEQRRLVHALIKQQQQQQDRGPVVR